LADTLKENGAYRQRDKDDRIERKEEEIES
jgi:hypothetical protein